MAVLNLIFIVGRFWVKDISIFHVKLTALTVDNFDLVFIVLSNIFLYIHILIKGRNLY